MLKIKNKKFFHFLITVKNHFLCSIIAVPGKTNSEQIALTCRFFSNN